MKKYLIAAILILSVINPSFAEDLEDSPVMNVQDVIFRSSLTNVIPDVNDEYDREYQYAFMDAGRTYKEVDPDNMPYFKQMRLKLSNKLLESSQANEDKEKVPLSKKLKFWGKKSKNDTTAEAETIPNESSISDSIQSETVTEIPEDILSLEGGINEQVTEKQLMLDADKVDYDDETGEIVALGRPILVLPPQNLKIIADKMTYNEDSNILKGIGNVIVYKDGMPTTGEYLEVDLNEETMVMDEIESKSAAMKMNAKKGFQKDGLLIMHDGSFHSDESQIYRLMSRMVGPRFQNMIISKEAQALLFGDPTGNNITLNIASLKIDAKKNHDVIKAKDIKVYRKDKYLFTWPRLTAYTNKERDYFEANYPEFGTKRKVGMFVGPGFVFGGPAGSVIKVIPFLNYNHKFGFGGALKYMNTYNHTELGYGSANEIFFLKGMQRLDDNLFLQYASNTYVNEWFLGPRMPKYMAEVYYDKSFSHKDFLVEGKSLHFRHRFGFGLMEDNDRNFYGEKIESSGMSTTRARYMAELRHDIYSYTNKEKRFDFNISYAMQGSAAVYGTGDTQFIARTGPSMHIQYKNWMQDVSYFLSGYSDETPIPRYDTYRYGHQSVYLTEGIRLNKYLSVGWAGNINLSNDSPNGKMFQENAFIVSVGPDDLKITLGYDFVRQTTYFGFNIAFDTKGTTVNYEKMEIKNPERLGKNTAKEEREEERKLAFAPAKREEVPVSDKKSKVAEQPKVLEYAEVIYIEDPDKETIQ